MTQLTTEETKKNFITDPAEIRQQMILAFKELRKVDLVCKANFLCCQSCAVSDIFDNKKNVATKLGYVTWNKQDEVVFSSTNYRWTDNRVLYLSFGSFKENEHCTKKVAELVINELKSRNLEVIWNGETNQKIQVRVNNHLASKAE
jgi:hypothetical protein